MLKVISRSTFDLQTGARYAGRVGGAAVRRRHGCASGWRRTALYQHVASYGVHRRACTNYIEAAADRAGPRHRSPAGPCSKARSFTFRTSQADPEFKLVERDRSFGGIRTMLGVPLLREGSADRRPDRCTRRERAPFTDKQIELVTTFADQAVIAIENVRLFDEVQKRTDDLPNRCSSRPPPPTCSRSSAARRSICRRCSTRWSKSAARLCDAEHGAPSRRARRRRFYRVATYGFPPEFLRIRQETSRSSPARSTGTGRAVARRQGRPHSRRPWPTPSSHWPEAQRTRRLPHHARRAAAARGRAGRRADADARADVGPFTDKQIELVDHLRRPGRRSPSRTCGCSTRSRTRAASSPRRASTSRSSSPT